MLVNGNDISEHLARFAPAGKYAPLGVNDYAVVDFRGNSKGTISGIKRRDKRITVFFKLGDFSSCRCIFEQKQAIMINLES